MSYNKVTYGSKTLIDLTEDTVTPEGLLDGLNAHDKSGAVITGTFLKGYPSLFNVEKPIQDSSGGFISDSTSKKVIGRVIYERK